MPKVKLLYVCPACGGTETQKVQWSGEIGPGGENDYNGWWIECLACGLQGPKPVWDRMARRRQDIQRALNLSDQDRRYTSAIEGFGQKMFRELKARDLHTGGNLLAWQPGNDEATAELKHHCEKLIYALTRERKEEVTEFAVDLANVAMLLDANRGVQ
jgi:hypothetical protein